MTTARVPPSLQAMLLILALAVWILERPYRGIIHDNRLYALQALTHNDPSVLGADLFFAFGSQDSFTLFSPLYGALIALLGLQLATVALVISGQVLWLTAAAALIRTLVPEGYRLFAFFCLAAFPAYYGAGQVFMFGESFLTPRLLAEALGMWALAAFLSAKRFLAVILLLAAALLHPLMAGAPMAAIAVMAVLRGRAGWAPAGLVAAGTLACLILLAISHWAGLPFITEIDEEWRAAFHLRQSFLFIRSWEAYEWLGLACASVLVGLAAHKARPPAGALLLTVLAVTLSSVLVSFVGFDLLENATIGALQVWRGAWLLHVLAPICLALLLREVDSAPAGNRLVSVLPFLVLSVFASLAPLPLASPLAFATAVLLAVQFMTRQAQARDPVYARLCTLVAAASLVVLAATGSFVLVRVIDLVMQLEEAAPGHFEEGAFLPSILRVALTGVGMALFLWKPRLTPPALLAAFGALAVSLFFWDRREEWRAYIDSTPDIAAQWTTPVAPHETVYWENDVTAIWWGLGRTSYFSALQGAGNIFNRGTALEFTRRLRAVSSLEPPSFWQAEMLGGDSSSTGLMVGEFRVLDEAGLFAACNAEGPPDVIVLDQKIDGLAHEHWRSPVTFTSTYRKTGTSGDRPEDFFSREVGDFFIYRCDAVRAASRASASDGG